MWCFSRMLISNVYKGMIVMNSIDTRFSRNVFEADKHSCSFFDHYLKPREFGDQLFFNVHIIQNVWTINGWPVCLNGIFRLYEV